MAVEWIEDAGMDVNAAGRDRGQVPLAKAFSANQTPDIPALSAATANSTHSRGGIVPSTLKLILGRSFITMVRLS
jgi:hypothetical protein